MKRIGFFVGHADYLPHATLLANSIQRRSVFGEDVEIFALVPEHLEFRLDIPGVTQIPFQFPVEYRTIPFVDKMLAAAAFEEACGDQYLWMDVDSCFFAAPIFPDDAEICINPVDKRNIGDLYGAPRSGLWQLLSEYFHLENRSAAFGLLVTTVSREAIYPYFNVGMVAVRKHRGVFSLVRVALNELLRKAEVLDLLHGAKINAVFIHQAVFTCAVMSLYGADSVKPLPSGVNYPLHLHDNHPNPMALTDLISIRYDTYFESHGVPACWQELFPKTPESLRMAWYY